MCAASAFFGSRLLSLPHTLCRCDCGLGAVLTMQARTHLLCHTHTHPTPVHHSKKKKGKPLLLWSGCDLGMRRLRGCGAGHRTWVPRSSLVNRRLGIVGGSCKSNHAPVEPNRAKCGCVYGAFYSNPPSKCSETSGIYGVGEQQICNGDQCGQRSRLVKELGFEASK